MAVRRIETILVWAPVVGGAAFLGYAVINSQVDASRHRSEAVAAGFDNIDDFDSAARAGIKTPAEWSAKLQTDAAAKRATEEKLAQDALRAKKEWDAQAPERERQASVAAAENKKRSEAEREARRPPVERLKLTNNSWRKGGFDSIGLMTFTITNDNEYSVKDFFLSCSFDAASGTSLGDRSHVLYEVVKAKSKRTFSNINIGFIPSQSARAGCNVYGAVKG